MNAPRIVIVVPALAAACSGSPPAPPDAGINPAPGSGVHAIALAGCDYQLMAPVTIGGQTFQLIQDSGATTLAVAAERCASCVDEGLVPELQTGSGVADLHQGANAFYNDNMSFGWSAELYRGAASLAGVVATVDFAGITTVSGGWGAIKCALPGGTLSASGGIGLGPTDVLTTGTTSFLDSAVAEGMPDAFALQLCPQTGTLWLGGYDPAALAEPLLYTPMIQSDGYKLWWTAALVGSGATATEVDVPPASQESLTDSDQGGMIVPDAIFTAITAAIEQDPAFQQDFGAAWFGATTAAYQNCIVLAKTPAQIDAELPPLTLRLGTADSIDVQLNPSESYLSYTPYSASQYQYCQWLVDGAARDFGSFADLGDVLAVGHVLVVDRAATRIGVARASSPCPGD